MQTIGQRIRAARTSAGLTQVDLAKRARIEQPKLSRLERDAGPGPRLGEAVRIADATGVGLLWLATGVGVGPISEAA